MKEEGTVKMNKNKVGQMSSWELRSRCQEEMKEGGIVSITKPGGINQGALASSLELDLLRVRVHLAKAEVQEGQAHEGFVREDHPDLQDGTPWMRKEMTIWEKWCLKKKERENSQGKDPKNL